MIIAHHVKTERDGWKEVARRDYAAAEWDKHDRAWIDDMLEEGDMCITVGWDMYQLVKN